MANPLADTDPGFERNPPPTCPLQVRSFGATDRGLVRPTNQDQFLIAVLNKAMRIERSSLPDSPVKYGEEQGYIFLVADGIGGASGGEVASALTVRSIEEFLLNTFKWFFHLQGPDERAVVTEFRDALTRVDAHLFAEAAAHRELHGMGTTLTMAYSIGRDLFIAHAGDSRCYLYREAELQQLTRDHTVAAQWLQEGLISPEQVSRHPSRHMVTNALGGSYRGVLTDVHKLQLASGDTLLLCTDGLNSMLTDQRMGMILHAEPDPKNACDRLISEALAEGGDDNVAVIVARYE